MRSCKQFIPVFVFALIVCYTPVFAAGDATEESLNQSPEDLKNDLDVIFESAGALVEQKEGEVKEKLEQYREKLEATVGDMSEESKEKIKSLAETAKTALEEGKKTLSKNLSSTLDSVRDEIDTLMDETESMSDEAKEKLSNQILEMKEKNKTIMKKLDQLKAEGLDSWKDFKTFPFDLWNDLEETYDKDLYGPDYEKV